MLSVNNNGYKFLQGRAFRKCMQEIHVTGNTCIQTTTYNDILSHDRQAVHQGLQYELHSDLTKLVMQIHTNFSFRFFYKNIFFKIFTSVLHDFNVYKLSSAHTECPQKRVLTWVTFFISRDRKSVNWTH